MEDSPRLPSEPHTHRTRVSMWGETGKMYMSVRMQRWLIIISWTIQNVRNLYRHFWYKVINYFGLEFWYRKLNTTKGTSFLWLSPGELQIPILSWKMTLKSLRCFFTFFLSFSLGKWPCLFNQTSLILLPLMMFDQVRLKLSQLLGRQRFF